MRMWVVEWRDLLNIGVRQCKNENVAMCGENFSMVILIVLNRHGKVIPAIYIIIYACQSCHALHKEMIIVKSIHTFT